MENEPVLQGQLGARLECARTDKHALSALLRDYMPFVKKCVSAVFFKGQSRADNLSDAMLAFVHSVQTYKGEYGAFVHYAAVVIRNRLIDNARRELAAQKPLLSLTAQSGETVVAWEADVSLRAFDRVEEEKNLRLEIEAVNGEFSQWGFSWPTLLKTCPKQERSRRVCWRIAEAVRESPELLAAILKARHLPITRLAETFPRKALEKYHHYIAALIILSQDDYPYVYAFVPRSFDKEDNV
jgi:RNA polymerase sigma factor